MLKIIQEEREYYLNLIASSNNRLVIRTANARLQHMNQLHRKFQRLTKS
jgi:hypothetical protein